MTGILGKEPVNRCPRPKIINIAPINGETIEILLDKMFMAKLGNKPMAIKIVMNPATVVNPKNIADSKLIFFSSKLRKYDTKLGSMGNEHGARTASNPALNARLMFAISMVNQSGLIVNFQSH